MQTTFEISDTGVVALIVRSEDATEAVALKAFFEQENPCYQMDWEAYKRAQATASVPWSVSYAAVEQRRKATGSQSACATDPSL